MSSNNSTPQKLVAQRAKYDTYKCWECGEKINLDDWQIFDKKRPRMQQNAHEKCYLNMMDRNSGQKDTNQQEDTRQQPQGNSSNSTNTELWVAGYLKAQYDIRQAVRAEVEKHPEYFKDEKDPNFSIGVTIHDICLVKLNNITVGEEIAKSKSVEIDGSVYSLSLNGALSSFHLPSTIKDTLDNWHKQSRSYFAPHLFFLIENRRFIPKCNIHGVVCNEYTCQCKKCDELQDEHIMRYSQNMRVMNNE